MKKPVATLIASIVIILVGWGISSSGTKAPADSAVKAPIKIGANLPLTGYGASWAENNRDGAQLAVNEINAKGGVLGRQLELVVQDNQSSPTAAVSVASKFINQDKIGFMLTAWSEFTVPVIPLLEQSKTLGVGVSVGDPTVSEKSPWFFDVWPRDGFLSQASADYMQSKGFKKVAIFRTIGSWENSVVPVFKGQIEKYGIIQTADESADPSKTDFKTQISKIKSSNPDVIYIQALEPSAGMFIKQARQLGLTTPIIYATSIDPSLMSAAGGMSSLEGLVFPVYRAPAADFSKRFSDEYKREPGVATDTSYDAVYLIAEAIKNGGSDEPEKVRIELAKIKDFPGVSGKITFDETRNRGGADVILMTIKGGQAVPLK